MNTDAVLALIADLYAQLNAAQQRAAAAEEQLAQLLADRDDESAP